MANLDLSILKICKGDTPVSFVAQGDNVVWPEAKPIEFEKFYANTTRLLLGTQTTRGGQMVEEGTAYLNKNNSGAILGCTFVWNQLFDGADKTVATMATHVYYSNINGTKTVFTSTGESYTSVTSTDMLINLTLLFGANPLNLPKTIEQFEYFFPLSYYSYSEPKFINTCITSLAFDSTDNDGNAYHSTMNIPITTLTGKLNGTGESVTIFPNGMAGAVYTDMIYKDGDVWKAMVRMQKTANIGTYTWYYNSSLSVFYTGSLSPRPLKGYGHCVSTRYNSNITAITNKGVFISYYVMDNGLHIRDTAYTDATTFKNSLDGVQLYYELYSPLTYVLDEQSLFDEIFNVSTNGTETAYPSNTDAPTTAPVRLNIQYPVIDYEVKRICVENWGGNIIPGEITQWEAAQVRTGSGLFDSQVRGNTTIQKFNEFKYFTGITGLCRGNSTTLGLFYNCTNLQEITIPRSVVSNVKGAFRQCTSLKELDLTPLIGNSFNINILLYSTVDMAYTKVKLPGGDYSSSGNLENAFRRAPLLTTIEIDGTANFSGITSYTDCFYNDTGLTTIIGNITGISANINLSACPLTKESALVILNGLANTETTKTVTFSRTTKALLTGADLSIATSKGWSVMPNDVVITFEDSAVKQICVENWGGGVVEGEITPEEAAQVTSFDNKFRLNTTITKFNELKYFTGLTSLQGSSSEQGQFQSCSNLSEITIPNTTALANLGWAFRQCTSLLNFDIDLTPISRTSIALNSPFREAKVHSVKFPAANYTGTMAYGFRTGSASTVNASVVSLIFDGTANFSSITSFNNCFAGQAKLTTITGTITGITQSISFAPCPLTVASAIVVLNGLATVSSAKTCTLRTAMKTTYEADNDFITARDAAISRGWSIAYANS